MGWEGAKWKVRRKVERRAGTQVEKRIMGPQWYEGKKNVSTSVNTGERRESGDEGDQITIRNVTPSASGHDG